MQGGYIRQERPYVTFAALFVSEKRDKGKVSLCFFTGRRGADPCLGDANTHAPHMCQFPYKIKPKYSQQTKQKIKVHSAFSFADAAAKEKLSKRKRRVEISRSAERDKSSALLIAPPSPKGGRKLCYSGRKL